MSETARGRAAVIGAGIYGLSTALHLQRDGWAVTLIDPVRPGDPAQASFGNGGILARGAVVPVSVPGLWKKLPGMLRDPDSPLFVNWRAMPGLAPWLADFLRAGRREEVARIAEGLAHLVTDAVEQHRALAGPLAAAHLQEGPYVYLYEDRAAFEADAYGFGLRAEHGIEWEAWDRARLLDEDPGVGPAYGFGVNLLGHAWVREPAAYLSALLGAFLSEGGVFRLAEARDLRPTETGVEVEIDGETLTADKAVLAGGVWSRDLAAKLGHRAIRRKLTSERGYHLALREPSHRAEIAYMLADAKFVATPMTLDGAPALRLAGLVELGDIDDPPSDAPIALLERKIRRLYPDLTWSRADSWLGHRPSPVDSLPFLGESPLARGVFFAFGAHHVGLTSGPKAGRIVADLVSGRRPNIDMSAFAPERFD